MCWENVTDYQIRMAIKVVNIRDKMKADIGTVIGLEFKQAQNWF